MTSEEIFGNQLYSSVYSEFYKKISDENERRVIAFLEPILEKLYQNSKTLLNYKDSLLQEPKEGVSAIKPKTVFENVFRLNEQRMKLFEKNIEFLKELKRNN